jgi:cytochrome P450
MSTAQLASADPYDVATPQGGNGVVGTLLRSQGVLAFGSWLSWRLTRMNGGPVRLGSIVIAVRHADVSEVLARDLEFVIAPINEPRIQAVNGPFVLGMDRGPTLMREREALYAALRRVDHARLRAQVEQAAARAIGSVTDRSLDVVGGYARPIATQTARTLFGLTGQDDKLFMDVVRAIFAHTFLNLGNDKTIEARALRAAAFMRQWFEEEIAERRKRNDPGDDMMGHLLKARLDDDIVRRTLGGMLVGSIDTTATSVAKIAVILGQDSDLYEQMRADRNDPARLTIWCLEALRRWPHNSILLRRAAVDTKIGTTKVNAGDTVIAFTQAAMLDPDVFPEPRAMDPNRPMSAYLHYGGGLHPCAGRAVNDFQITLLIKHLLDRGIESVGRVTWAGAFPDRLVVTLSGERA